MVGRPSLVMRGSGRGYRRTLRNGSRPALRHDRVPWQVSYVTATGHRNDTRVFHQILPAAFYFFTASLAHEGDDQKDVATPEPLETILLYWSCLRTPFRTLAKKKVPRSKRQVSTDSNFLEVSACRSVPLRLSITMTRHSRHTHEAEPSPYGCVLRRTTPRPVPHRRGPCNQDQIWHGGGWVSSLWTSYSWKRGLLLHDGTCGVTVTCRGRFYFRPRWEDSSTELSGRFGCSPRRRPGWPLGLVFFALLPMRHTRTSAGSPMGSARPSALARRGRQRRARTQQHCQVPSPASRTWDGNLAFSNLLQHGREAGYVAPRWCEECERRVQHIPPQHRQKA